MNSAIHTLFALCFVVMTVFAEDPKLRDAGNHLRNLACFAVGLAIGLVVLFTGIMCWKCFEGFDLCNGKKKYSAPPETGAYVE